jgi:hypothetical protein
VRTCRVLIHDVQPRLFESLVELLMSTRADVSIVAAGEDQGEVDLEISGSPDPDPGTTRLLVGVNGTHARLEVSHGELTQEVLALAVAAAVREQPDLTWYEALVDAAGRFSEVLDEAVACATEAYEAGGGPGDWVEAFKAGRTDFGGAPMSAAFSRASAMAPGPGASLPADSASGRMIRDYDLSPRQVDVLLACLFNELDARFAKRYAYLVGDSLAAGPTVDVLAELLCSDTRDRLSLVSDLESGVLVSAGLIHRTSAGEAIRHQVFALDDSVRRILLGDESPDEADTIIDPELSPRTSDEWAPPSGGPTPAVVAALGTGRLVHVHGGVDADRRSRALDIADEVGCRLLVVSWTRFADLDLLGAHRLRRHCLRTGLRCLVEGVPRDADAELLRLAGSARVALTSGPDALPPGGPVWLLNDAYRSPTLPERRIIWTAAADWTGSAPADGLEALVLRFGVAVDRAAEALIAAGADDAPYTSQDVAAVLSEQTREDAGGLLQPLKPRASFDDLVLNAETRLGLEEARNRIIFRDVVTGRLGWDRMTDRLTGTYLLFAGPAGAGKTLAAEALAHELGLPVQLLEISALFSRWVGDFEERVDRVFQAAQSSGALLVVNEADAILGPRTQVVHAQDRYANAGTSHVLSRLEQFTGHVVFTTNLLGVNNIDPAFHRRISAVVRFHQPDRQQREELWRTVWPTRTRDGADVEIAFETGMDAYFSDLARDHALSGGSIANVARSATFLAAARDAETPVVTQEDVRAALAQELSKIGDFRALTRTRVAT